MGLGALRNLLRPICGGALSRTNFFHASLRSKTVSSSPVAFLTSFLQVGHSGSVCPWTHWNQSLNLQSLTDNRFPKRRPGFVNRRKRASLRPPGPYAWVQYVPGEQFPRSRPNKGSVQGRNRIKRIKQRKAFIKSEAKKRKTQVQEANRKKRMKRIERKMAAVAREKAWAERLVELKKLEEEKKAAIA